MKSKKILFGMFAALALAGCSSDDVAINGNDSQISDGTTNYLSVQIMNASGTATRASGDGYPETSAKYEDGTGAENTVNSVRFYFFLDDGTATAIKADGKNYLDWDNPGTASAPDPINVEKVLEAKLVISTPAGDKVPSKILAILNPTSEFKASIVGSATQASLDEIRHTVNDYAKYANDENSPSFVMVNSVYKNAGGNRVSATDIPADKLKSSENDATDDPVDIYVERNVAKVKFTYKGTDSETSDSKLYIPVYKKNTSTGEYEQATVEGKPVYFLEEGWIPTATTLKGYLSKHINTSWKDNLFGTVSWNYETYHRSFWAVNPNIESNTEPEGDQAGYKYYSFNECTTAQPVTATNSPYIYVNENAGTKTDGEQRAFTTQIMACGTLVTKDSGTYTPVEIGSYAGSNYYGKDALIDQMVQFVSLYKRWTETTLDGDVIAVKHITADDVELETCNDDYLTPDASSSLIQANTGGRYKVRLKLKTLADNIEIVKTESSTAAAATNDEITAALKAVEGQMRNEGKTYYWFRIPHLSTQNIGKYGVVRNHIYDITFDKVVGYGTPVYDPDKTIYPETPQDEDTYIAARLNILQWRIVSKNVTLGE